MCRFITFSHKKTILVLHVTKYSLIKLEQKLFVQQTRGPILKVKKKQ